MLWQNYVFKRNHEIPSLWESIFSGRECKLIYITGCGFDVRSKIVLEYFISTVTPCKVGSFKPKLVVVDISSYQLNDELLKLTQDNEADLIKIFESIGEIEKFKFSDFFEGGEGSSQSNSIRLLVDRVLVAIEGYNEIIFDVSSFPRVIFLSLLTGILRKIISNKEIENPLCQNDVNFQILVAEDPILDGRIKGEDPSNELIMIPGFSTALHAEYTQDWPLVWFPILGENRVNQLKRVMDLEIPSEAEICPVLPHPSRDPRRADKLLLEYRIPLFDERQTPSSNILFVHESHPFETYRQIFKAMERYKNSLSILGGCRLIVTPLSSKLITIGAGLACFDFRPSDSNKNYCVAIPNVSPTRYDADANSISKANPEIFALLLTGNAFQ